MSKGFANHRVALLASIVFVSFVGLGGRLVWLQVGDRDALLDSIGKARRQVIVENARRGDILDAHGNLLATSRSLIELGVDPQSLRPGDEKKWPRLAELIGRPLPEVAAILTTRFRPAAAPVRPPEGVGTTDHTPAAGPVSLVFTLPGGRGQAAQPGPAGDGDDDTVVDDADPQGNQPIRWARLSESVPESAYVEIKKLGIQGIVGNRIYRRSYPDNELAAHVIGYVNHDENPVTGVEAFADFYLRGQNGWVETEKDGRRQELPQFRSRVVPAVDGYNVTLSIDATVQHIVEAELSTIASKFHPLKATIIVSDPRTGFILGLGNYPSFNLNEYNKVGPDRQAELRNVAVADMYEPGSVFKIIPAAGALNEGLVTPATTFDCTLEKVDYNEGGVVRTLRLPREDASDHFAHPLTVAQILGRSSNKGAAQLGMMLGKRRLYDYARAFGIGEVTTLPVGSEIRGWLPPPERWDGLTITRLPMGQGVTLTPMQMHQAMSVIASGGLLLRPQIIREIRDSQGAIVCWFSPAVVRRAISERTAQTMQRLLATVATAPIGEADGGMGAELAIPGYEVAGKTGTAQKVEPVMLTSGKTVMRYSNRHHVGSFVGFLPARNPQVVISVIVDDADAYTQGGVGYGVKVAGPSFKHIGEQLIPYLDIRPADLPVRSPLAALGGGHP